MTMSVKIDDPEALKAKLDELQRYMQKVEAWKDEGERLFSEVHRRPALRGERVGLRLAFAAGEWWADRPWRSVARE